MYLYVDTYIHSVSWICIYTYKYIYVPCLLAASAQACPRALRNRRSPKRTHTQTRTNAHKYTHTNTASLTVMQYTYAYASKDNDKRFEFVCGYAVRVAYGTVERGT